MGGEDKVFLLYYVVVEVFVIKFGDFGVECGDVFGVVGDGVVGVDCWVVEIFEIVVIFVWVIELVYC